MEGPIIIFIVVIVFVTIIGVNYFFSKKKAVLRELKKSSTKKVKLVRENEYVKLVGKALGGNEPLIAPLSQRECLCYYVIVEKKGNKNRWYKYVEEEQFQDFFLKTEDDMVLVRPSKTLIDFQKTYYVIDHKDRSGFLNDAKPRLETYLKSFNKKSYGILGLNKTLRYSEGIIESNEKITVKGIAKWKIVSEPIKDYNNLKILTLEGNAQEKLIITDYSETTISK